MRGSERPSLCWRETTSPRAARSRFSRSATRAVQSWRPGRGSLRETVAREFEIASTGKPDKNLDASDRDELRVRLAFGSVPSGLRAHPRSRTGVARWHERLGLLGRCRRRGPRLSRGASLWQLDRVLRAGTPRDCRVPARGPGRHEDGGRAAPRARVSVTTMADRKGSRSKRRPPAGAPGGPKGAGAACSKRARRSKAGNQDVGARTIPPLRRSSARARTKALRRARARLAS